MNLTKSAIGILCGVLLAGCSNNFLDLAPQSQVSTNEFYRTAQDMTVAVDAAYAALTNSGQYNNLYILAEMRSDNTTGVGSVSFDTFSETTTDVLLANTWRDHYNGIARCNIILNRIGGVPMDAKLKDQYVGEVKFLRALMYFNLVRLFGGVPLVLDEVKSGQQALTYGRSSAEDVYQAITADLREAEAKLPVSFTGTDLGRATQGAARSLLGKVYLTLHKYPEAAAKLKEVIDQGTYRLLPKYADIYVPINAHHAESIFEVNYKSGGLGLGSPFTTAFARRGDFIIVFRVGGGNDQNLPTQDLLDAYETKGSVIADQRYAASMDTGYVDTKGKYSRQNFTKKFLFPEPQAFDSDTNWPVLRYADVLLMYAEALNEVSKGPNPEAYKYINLVRSRAGLAPLDKLDYLTFKLAMEHERQVELAFENHRWFDLLRTGRALAVMNQHFKNLKSKATVQPYQLLFPVPKSQIDINPEKMKQNPGYN